MSPVLDLSKTRISKHALERFAGWMNYPDRVPPERIEEGFRTWLKSAKPADPVKERRAVALIDNGEDARYLLHAGYIAVLVTDGRHGEVVVTFHANNRKWYSGRKTP